MKQKKKFIKRNPKKMGKRNHKLEKILIEELDRMEHEDHQVEQEHTDEKE